MNRYWLRIGIGVILVFCLGMSAMAAVRKGKAEIGNFLSTASARLPLQLANLKFRFDGRAVGSISGLDVERNDASDEGRVTVRVTLSDLGVLDELRDCSLTVDELQHISTRTGFRCATASELGAGDLVKAGDVSFAPGDLSRPLYLLRRDVSRWRRSEIRSLNASLNTQPNGGVKAQGSFDVRGDAGDPERGSFTLNADSNGAVISVKDDRGRSLVNFRADHNGVNLNVSDRHGRNLLKLLADSVGAALKIHH
jgi:hypothetical protein